MKKIITFIAFLIIISVLSGCGSQNVAEAGYERLFEEESQDMGGYHFGEDEACIVYSNYIFATTGRMFMYELMYDKEFFVENSVNCCNALRIMGNSFEKSGYEVTINESTGYMRAALIFESTEEFYIANGYDGFEMDDSTDMEEEKSFFFIDYTYKTETIFSSILDEKKFIGRLYDVCCRDLGLSYDKVVYKYAYGTPYDKQMITTNADTVSYSSEYGIYLHILTLDENSFSKEFVIRQHIPNSAMWYFVAIGVGVIVFLIPLTVCLISKKRKGE